MDIWELSAREAIRQTLADYTAGTDGFALRDMASCFTPDGILEYTGGEPLVGPDAIVEGLRTRAVGGGATALTHVRHHVSSVRFRTLAADHAEVSSYFVVFTDVGVDHWGRYRDVLVPQHGKGSGRWLFSARKVSVDGFSDHSLMRPAPNVSEE